jgi:MFS family permease
MQLKGSQSILWQQVWGLSAIIATVIFCWMAYNLYQPKILQELGFVKLAGWLGIIQGLLGAFIEPWVGAVSDRIQHRFGSRLPIITLGVTLAGLIFVAIAILLQWQIPTSIRWIVPILMTLWVISMIIFRGPAIALLRQATPLAALPKANVVLTMVFGLIGAMEPLMAGWLEGIGASITFIIGAIALVVGATILYSFTPRQDLFPISIAAKSLISRQLIALIFSVGLGVGIEINLLLRVFPQMMHPQLSNFNNGEITSGILLISALVAVPMGIITLKLGVKRTMLLGLAIMVAIFGLVIFHPSGILGLGLIFIGGIAFGLVFESQIPLALSMLPSDRAGLATGLYFGGIGAATSIISIIWQNSGLIAPIIGAIAFTLVALCLDRSTNIN